MSREVSAEVKAHLDVLAAGLPGGIGNAIRLLVEFAMRDEVDGVACCVTGIIDGVDWYGEDRYDLGAREAGR